MMTFLLDVKHYGKKIFFIIYIFFILKIFKLARQFPFNVFIVLKTVFYYFKFNFILKIDKTTKNLKEL